MTILNTGNVDRDMALHCHSLLLTMNNAEHNAPQLQKIAENLPGWLNSNGLGATVAWMVSRYRAHKTDGQAAKLVLDGFLGWLVDYRELTDVDTSDPLSTVFKANQDDYLFYTEEFVRFTIWLKRLAKIL